MFERFTDRARKIMALANIEAQAQNHACIRTEHILLGLLKEGSGVGATALRNCNIDLKKMRQAVVAVMKPGTVKLESGKLPQDPTAKHVIELAIAEAKSFKHNYVGSEHILLGLASNQETIAGKVLADHKLSVEILRKEVLGLLGGEEAYNLYERTRQIRARLENTDSALFTVSELFGPVNKIYKGKKEPTKADLDLVEWILNGRPPDQKPEVFALTVEIPQEPRPGSRMAINELLASYIRQHAEKEDPKK